jgi:V/A-type H+-transporting ATPase subunit K
MGIVLAFIGLGLMVGLSGTGSATGLVISGQAAMGLIKKKPEDFGISLGMASPPATQGLYGFVAYMLYSGKLKELTANGDLSIFSGAVTLGAGLAVGIACLVSAIYQGKVCASGLAAKATGADVVAPTFVLAAFPEFYAILSLVVSILMMGMLK